MAEYKKQVTEAIYLHTSKFMEDINIGIKEYITYLLKDGSPKAKFDLLQCLDLPTKLHNRFLVD